LKVTALSPSLIVQRPCFSDIVGKEVAACGENHQTCIDSLHPQSNAFSASMRFQAAAFARAGYLDRLRGVWKKLNGF
jgi:hypothetical protein